MVQAQKQKYKSMEQDRKFTDTYAPTVNQYMTKARIYSVEKDNLFKKWCWECM